MIGETLYTHDTNRRKYVDDGNGCQVADPSFHWRAHTVTGENKVSWILDNGEYKADKKTLELRGIREFYGLSHRAYTQADMEDALWMSQHYARILDAVRRADVGKLREIAAILGL
jgi:hypothetical protein